MNNVADLQSALQFGIELVLNTDTNKGIIKPFF